MNYIDALMQDHADMAKDRGLWVDQWEKCAKFCLPNADSFHDTITHGQIKTKSIYDSSPIMALSKFASGVESMITPRAQTWHGLTSTDPNIAQDEEVIAFFQKLTRTLFSVRYNPKAAFGSQSQEYYLSLGAFGTGCLFIDSSSTAPLRYESIHLSELYISENNEKIVDKVHRKFMMSARQAVIEFRGNVSNQIIKAVDNNNGETKFKFIHMVLPSKEVLKTHRSKKLYTSFYIDETNKSIVSSGGYDTMPYLVGRYMTGPGETWGRGPASIALPDMAVLNSMGRVNLRAGSRAVEPPLFAATNAGISSINLQPNAINFGMLDQATGRPSIAPFNNQADIGLGMAMQDQKRLSIREAFLNDLFSSFNGDRSAMTATEILARQEEKAQILTPIIGRQQTEFLAPLIEREISLLAQNGFLPPVPDQLLQSGGGFEVVYDSPLNRAQQADRALGLFRTLEALQPLLQVAPDPQALLRRFNFDKVVEGLAKLNAVPSEWLSTDAEIEAIMQQKNEQNQRRELLESAPIAAQTVESIAKSQALKSAGIIHV